MRGSAQPAPPRASGFFLPSLSFSGSAAGPLGPGFFRLFTSDMSGTLKISKPGGLTGVPMDVAAARLQEPRPPPRMGPAYQPAPPLVSSRPASRLRVPLLDRVRELKLAGARRLPGRDEKGGAERATSVWARPRVLAPPHCACGDALRGLAGTRRAGYARWPAL